MGGPSGTCSAELIEENSDKLSLFKDISEHVEHLGFEICIYGSKIRRLTSYATCCTTINHIY